MEDRKSHALMTDFENVAKVIFGTDNKINFVKFKKINKRL